MKKLLKLVELSDQLVALLLVLVFLPEHAKTLIKVLAWPPSGKRFDAAYEETLKALR